MTFEQTLITTGVLFGLFILGYCAIMKKNLMEVFKEIIGLFKNEL